MVNVVLKNAEQCAPADRAYTSHIQNKKNSEKVRLLLGHDEMKPKRQQESKWVEFNAPPDTI